MISSKTQAMYDVIAKLGTDATNESIRKKLKAKYGIEVNEVHFYSLKGLAIKKLGSRRKKKRAV